MFEKGLHLMSSFLDGPLWLYQGIPIFVSWPLLVIEAFLIVQNVRKSHIYIDVVKQHTAQNAYFLRKSPKTDFQAFFARKISFWRFCQIISILEYMLLHNFNINVAIAVILLGQKSLYDHQELS